MQSLYLLESNTFDLIKGARGQRSLAPFFYALFMFISACSSTEKPTQEMIFANAAMKAAERSLAEKRAPDLFRRAEQAHWRAQRYYLARDFEEAKKSAELTRRLAEKAEFSAELKAAEEDEFYE